MSADAPSADSEQGPRPCLACSETGKVVSNLGGSPATVDCPWCDGTGQVTPGHDAQARWK